jgi:hypothetical protein
MKKSFAEHYKNIMNQHDRNVNTILLDSITRDNFNTNNFNTNNIKRGYKRKYIQISESDSEEQERKDEKIITEK